MYSMLFLLLIHVTLCIVNGPTQDLDPQRANFIHKEAHHGSVRSIAIAPDDKTMVSLGFDQELKLWTTSDGKLLGQHKLQHKLLSNAAYSPDGKEIAVGEEDGQVVFFNATNLQLRSRTRFHQKPIQFLDYSPDGKTIATASHDGTIRVWDRTTGKERNKINFTSWHFSFHSDSNSLLIPSNSGIQLWNLQPLRLERTFYQAGLQHTPAFFSADGKIVIGEVESGKGLFLWDRTTGKIKESVFGFFTSDCPVAISPDAKTIITKSADRIGNEGFTLWNLESGQPEMRTAKLGYSLTNGKLSIGNRGIAVGNYDGIVAFYSRFKSNIQTTKPSLRSEMVNQLERLHLEKSEWRMGRSAISHDGKRLFLSAKDTEVPMSIVGKYQQLGFVRIWDIAAKKELAVIPPQSSERFGNYRGEIMTPVSALAISPDDKVLAIANELKISLWDIETQKRLCEVNGLDKNIVALDVNLRFTSDGKRLAISCTTGTWLWDIASRKMIMKAPEGGHLAFLAKDQFYATAMYHNRMKLWETATGKEVAEDHPELGILRECCISEDNQWLIGAGEGGGMIWKLSNSKTKPVLQRHHELKTQGPVYGLGLSRDGKRALTVGSIPQLWDVETGSQLAELKSVKRAIHGSLSPDGKLAVLLGNDGVYLWRP
jgi:WD40 repeat protein